jgi:hypothetical protein
MLRGIAYFYYLESTASASSSVELEKRRKNCYPLKMSNFWNSLKAPTLANQNLAKIESHVGHFKKIC